jgi:hypothetical protein
VVGGRIEIVSVPQGTAEITATIFVVSHAVMLPITFSANGAIQPQPRLGLGFTVAFYDR